jgi:hypothetical protein
MGGRVVLVNSDTPVPYALVRFLNYSDDDDILGPNTYEFVNSVVTDSLGQFPIPPNISEVAIAYGREDVFDTPSIAAGLSAYSQHGGQVKIYLTPPAWIRVQAVDIEPLNPEIESVRALRPGIGPSDVSIDTQIIWKLSGNMEFEIAYRYYYNNIDHSDLLFYRVTPAAFDTLDVMITY